MTTGITWGQTLSHFADNTLYTPLAYAGSKVSGLNDFVSTKNFLAFLNTESSLTTKVASIPQKLWSGMTTSLKVDNLTFPTREGLVSFIHSNRVSLGVGAAWGFAHSVVDGIAARYMSDTLWVRSTSTYALSGVMIWGAAQAMDYEISPEEMGNIALNAYFWSGVGKTAYFAIGALYSVRNKFWWSGSYPTAQKAQKPDDLGSSEGGGSSSVAGTEGSEGSESTPEGEDPREKKTN